MHQKLFNSLNFIYCEGDITEVRAPYHEGSHWRLLPYWVISHSSHGQGAVEINSQSPVAIVHGDVSVIPPNTLHRFSVAPKSIGISRWCHVQYPVIHGLDVSHFLKVPTILKASTTTTRIAKINEQLAKTNKAQTNDIIKAATMKELGFKLLKLIAKQGQFHNQQILHDITSQWLLSVLKFVAENLSSAITRDSLAEIADFSPSRFHTLFKNIMQIGPMEFVRKTRMNKACELLAQSATPISEISLLVGYPDPYVFSRTFKKEIGLPPIKFRKNYIANL